MRVGRSRAAYRWLLTGLVSLDAAVAVTAAVVWAEPTVRRLFDDPLLSLAGADGGVAAAVTWLGSRLVLLPALAAVALVLWRRDRGAVVVGAGALLAGAVVEFTLKAAIDRPRPAEAAIIGPTLGSAFPSGHALTAVVAWGMVPLVLRRWGAGPATVRRWSLVALVVVVAVAWSRVVLGVHWPSDVLGGLLYGTVVLAGAAWALEGTGGPTLPGADVPSEVSDRNGADGASW